MSAIPEIRQKIGTIDLDGREITLLQRDGDPYDQVRLAYTDALDDELGRVVDLCSPRPQLATALAVWTTSTRNEVLGEVRESWRHYELEVIA
jgi:hypothetical protein